MERRGEERRGKEGHVERQRRKGATLLVILAGTAAEVTRCINLAGNFADVSYLSSLTTSLSDSLAPSLLTSPFPVRSSLSSFWCCLNFGVKEFKKNDVNIIPFFTDLKDDSAGWK
eukprot:747083-Hanusia_phi.AAC.1